LLQAPVNRRGESGECVSHCSTRDVGKVAIGGWLEHLSEQGTPWPEPNPAALADVDAVTHPTAEARHD